MLVVELEVGIVGGVKRMIVSSPLIITSGATLTSFKESKIVEGSTAAERCSKMISTGAFGCTFFKSGAGASRETPIESAGTIDASDC